jgi:diguanylate cyclase (GGDEF)-like protein
MRSRPVDPNRRDSSRKASIEHVLVENEKIKTSVERAAGDLTLVNDVLKQDDVPLLVMRKALSRNQGVEHEISKAAGDLKMVNVTLASEMAERIVIESELSSVRSDLAGVRDDLLNAQVREKAAREAALRDGLTGLQNRSSFEQGLAHGLVQATRHGWNLAVLFIDIDGFKGINDSYGHVLGDRVLLTTATRLKSFFRDEDIICRWGGDEFVCLLMEVQQEDDVARLAEQLCERIAEPCTYTEATLVTRLSIGIAVFPEDGATAGTLVRNADEAMYEAKRTGKRIMMFRDLRQRERPAGLPGSSP